MQFPAAVCNGPKRIRVFLTLLLVQTLFVQVQPEGVPCGTIPGAAEFEATGDELRAAAACFVLGSNCGSTKLAVEARGSPASVQEYYGD
jgi:hypothetical protein